MEYVLALHVTLLTAHAVVAAATLLVLPCVATAPSLVARPVALPVLALLAGLLLAALFAYNGVLSPEAAASTSIDVRVLGGAAAAYAAAHAAHVWQLACLDVHASSVSTLALVGVVPVPGRRALARMRLAYGLSRAYVAAAVASVLWAAQSGIVLGTHAAGAPPWLWATMGSTAWIALGGAQVGALYGARRRLGATMTTSRREVIRVWASWCVALPAAGVAHALGAAPSVVALPLETAALVALLSSTSASVLSAAVRALSGSALCVRTRARARSRRSHGGGGGGGGGDGVDSADESDVAAFVVPPSRVVALSYLRAVYRDDDLFVAWLAYVRQHHPSRTPEAVGLHTVGMVDSGALPLDQALHQLHSSSALPLIYATPLWTAADSAAAAAVAGGVGAARPPRRARFSDAEGGRAAVLYMCAQLESTMRAFVERSAALRALAVEAYFATRTAARAPSSAAEPHCPVALNEYVLLLAQGAAASDFTIGDDDDDDDDDDEGTPLAELARTAAAAAVA